MIRGVSAPLSNACVCTCICMYVGIEVRVYMNLTISEFMRVYQFMYVGMYVCRNAGM